MKQHPIDTTPLTHHHHASGVAAGLPEPSDHQHHHHVQYPYRWVILGVFAFCNFTNAVLWICFAPIVSTCTSYFGVSSTAINSLSAVYMALFVPGSALTAWLLDRHGLRTAVVLASFVQFAGAWLRFAATDASLNGDDAARTPTALSFTLLMSGQLLAAMVQPIFTNSPTKLAATWFTHNQRNVATTLASMSNPIGIAFAQVMPSMFVSTNTGTGMSVMLLVQAAMASAAAALAFFLFRNEPPTPPSQVAEKHAHHSGMASGGIMNDPVVIDTLALLRDRNFRLLMSGFGIGLGLFNGLTTVLDQLVAPVGYSEDDAGNFGAALIGCGLLGAAIIGPLMDATHRYNQILKAGGTGALLSLLFLMLSLRRDMFGLVMSAWAFLGFCVLPLLPVALECAVECTFPVSEDLSAGLLMCAGNIVGVIVTYSLDPIVKMSPLYSVVTPAFLFIVSLMSVGWVCLLAYNGPLKRTRQDQIEEQGEEEDGANANVVIGPGNNKTPTPPSVQYSAGL